MARINKIRLGPVQRNCPQAEEAIMAADLAPGTIVYKNSNGKFAAFATEGEGEGVKLYVLNHSFASGGQIDDDVEADTTGIAEPLFSEDLLAMLVATGNNLNVADKPLAISATAGVLKIGVPGTDFIVGYAQEIYNNNTGSSQLVRVRPA